ncbi:MAG: hypothetical protein AAB368_17260, partial [bacterium]
MMPRRPAADLVRALLLSYTFVAAANPARGAWSATGLWHQIPDVSGPGGRLFASLTPDTWWYGQDATGDYDTGAANSGSLTTTPFTVSAGDFLMFSSWEETEVAMTFDTRWLSISTDGGFSWTPLRQLFGPTASWYQPRVDLAPYVGQTALFRFDFDTVDDVFNNFGGWYVDDLYVGPAAALTATLTVIPPAAAVGQWVTVEMTVTNEGSLSALS